MKALFISIILFSILLGVIITNSIYIVSESEKLIYIVNKIPQPNNKESMILINLLEERWNKFRAVAILSLSYSDIAQMDSYIEELKCHYNTCNINDFEYTKSVMIQSIKSMIRLEKLSWDGIL